MNKKLELNWKIIASAEDWAAVRRHFIECNCIALDTEFMRDRTYYPQLCLVQLATEEHMVCLDPLAFDFSSILAEILANEKVVKIIHSASQDIEVLGRYCKVRMCNIFDTQLAAEFAGIADQIGYATLVESLLQIELPKSQTRSNWARRPLSERQIEYCLNDVKYLIPLFKQLTATLEKSDKLNWYTEEQHNELERMNDYHINPDLAYKNIKVSHRLDNDAQLLVKLLVNWRERVAQSTNKPKHWIIKDKYITEIADQMPQSKQLLKPITAQDPRFKNKYLNDIFSLIEQSKQKSQAQIWSNQNQLTDSQKLKILQLRKKIKSLARHYNLSATRLGTRRDMIEFIRSGNGRLAQGWRKQILSTEDSGQ